MQPFLHELSGAEAQNPLHDAWVKYALSFSEDDIKELIKRGLTHQLHGLRAMVNEIVSGGYMPPSLYNKLERMVLIGKNSADQLRG